MASIANEYQLSTALQAWSPFFYLLRYQLFSSFGEPPHERRKPEEVCDDRFRCRKDLGSWAESYETGNEQTEGHGEDDEQARQHHRLMEIRLGCFKK